MKFSLSLVSLVIMVVILSTVTSGKNGAAETCGSKSLESISECSTCCAIGGFNKFDHKKFLENRECKCFKDLAELDFNSGSKQKKTGQQKPLGRP